MINMRRRITTGLVGMGLLLFLVDVLFTPGYNPSGSTAPLWLPLAVVGAAFVALGIIYAVLTTRSTT